ncbi:MAG: collagen-like protein, partial [Candidatus Zixiibacteriota bacterium]
MKKTIIFFAGLLLSIVIFAQAPERFSYQAIVRDNTGQPLTNAAVTVQFNILQGSATGTTVYSENHSETTNDFGLVNMQIGAGIVNSGTFSTIDWGGDAYYLNIQIDQGSGFVDMGTQQFISVPYAMYAKSAGSSGVAGNTGDVQLND